MSRQFQSQSVRTYTTTDSSGKKTTVTETTVTTADGKVTTTREESTSSGSTSRMMENPKFEAIGSFSTPSKDNPKFDAIGSFSTPSKSSQPSSKSEGGTDLKSFRQQALKAHNERRRKHGVPDLKLSADLNDFAQKWADHLISSNKFEHSNCTLGGDRLGENIANKWSSAGADFTGEEVTQNWYSEISKHNFSADSSRGTGHFTQVVWKGSQELGMGKATDGRGKVIVVGSYRPAGNMIGSFAQNVFPPK